MIEELIALAKELRDADSGVKNWTERGRVAFYDALGTNDSAVQVLGRQLRLIAQELLTTVREN